MPTYTYECKNCSRKQDQFHAISAKPRVKCTVCGGACRRMIGSGAGLIFKGSGFYETDYKSRSGSSSDTASAVAKSESPAKSESSSKTDSTTESTPRTETKTETKSEPKSNGKKAKATSSAE